MTFFGFEEKIREDTQFAIFGIPWDYLTSKDLPNSSTAPESIRTITDDIGYITELGFNITKFRAADVGDVKIEPVDVEKNITSIYNFLNNCFIA